MAASERIVAVLGATGYTGRLIAHELHRHGIRMLLAGRDPDRLQALAADVGGAETLVAKVGDQGSIDALARRALVLVNTVGPFVDLGEPVVRAAIAAAAHYVDTTGEQPFVQSIMVHDTWAKTQGVTVVPSLGFEITLADCGAALAAAELDTVERMAITYVTEFLASQGTKRTVLRMLQRDGYAYLGGTWVAEPPARRSIFVDLPGPIGSVAAVSFPGAEIITIPRHVATAEVRTYLKLPVLAARVLSATAPVVRTLARSPLGDALAGLVAQGTEGPDETARRMDGFHVVVDARGTRRGKSLVQRVVVRGRDRYGVTAATIRQGVQRLLAGGCSAGVLSPAMAFDPRHVLDELARDGVAYDVIPLVDAEHV